MPSPKMKTSQYQKLFQQNTESHSPNQKIFIEAFIKKLNEKIQKDPLLQVKAARIIEDWIKRSPKKSK